MKYGSNARAGAARVNPAHLSSPYLRIAIAAFVGSLLPAAALAQTAPGEEEIIVTGGLERPRIESMQGAAVLNRDDIVARLNGGLGDTLDSQLGVSTTFFGAGASRPIIRGLGDDRVRVLQNGIGAIDASTASPDHAVTADGLDAERIEILRGAAALAYGGNAIGGVVNVIDQSIPTRAIEGLEFSGLAGYSSVDEGVQGDADLGFGAGAFAFRLSVAGREAEPYDTPVGEALNQWTKLRTYAGGASAVGDWGFVGLGVKRTESDYGLYPEDPAEAGGYIEMEQTRIESRGQFRVALGPFEEIGYAAQHSDYEHTEFEGDGAPGGVFRNEGYEARLEAHHHGARTHAVVGLQASDVDFEVVSDHPLLPLPTNTRDIGLFALERWDNGGWGVEGGLRYEQREVSDTAVSREFDNVSGSLGVFFRPAETWFLSATVAHSERAPTAVELFADGPHHATETYEIGDVNLQQEEALSFEASARFDNGPLRFEFNVFHAAFKNYIALVGSDLFFWEGPSAPFEGFDLEADVPGDAEEVLQVFEFLQQDASFTGAEVFVGADLFELGAVRIVGDVAFDVVRAEFDAGGHPPRIPARSFTLGLGAESAHWDARVEMVDVAAQTEVAQFESPTEGYTFVNASLAFRPAGENSAWTIRLDGRNLTDELGRVHSSYLKDELPLPGRNVRLTVSTRF